MNVNVLHEINRVKMLLEIAEEIMDGIFCIAGLEENEVRHWAHLAQQLTTLRGDLAYNWLEAKRKLRGE